MKKKSIKSKEIAGNVANVQHKERVWIERIDKLKERMGLETDAQAAVFIGTSPQVLSAVRAFTRELPVKNKLRLMDMGGYQWARDAILALLPAAEAKKIIEWNNSVTKSLAATDVDSMKMDFELPAAVENASVHW